MKKEDKNRGGSGGRKERENTFEHIRRKIQVILGIYFLLHVVSNKRQHLHSKGYGGPMRTALVG